MKIKLVVFDMAGTVVDEDNVVYKTLQQAINAQGYNFTLPEVLAVGAGKEKMQATRDILLLQPTKFSESIARKIYADFVVLLTDAYEILEVLPQPGANELFTDLHSRGILVALNTGYNRETAMSLMKKLRWEEGRDVDAIITATDTRRNRPHPDMIEFAMTKLNIAASSAVVKVGDSIIDIEEGRNAGCALCIGITTGAHTREQLQSASPDYIINHLNELPALLA